MSGEEAPSVPKEFLSRACEECGPEKVMIEPVMGQSKRHDDSLVPAVIYEHGMADDNRPHWRVEIPIRRRE